MFGGRAATAIVNRMDEFALLLAGPGDHVVLKAAPDPDYLSYLTSLGIERSHPDYGHQWITIVDPDHRGRRLGTVVKLENLAQARREEPRLAAVDTWNADSNRHMIGINETMGFRAVDSWVNWQAEI